jgi:hypothetical protein
MLVPPNCRRTTQLRQPGPHRSAYLACLDLSLRLLHGDPLIRRSAVEKFARCDPLIEIELLRGWQRARTAFSNFFRLYWMFPIGA